MGQWDVTNRILGRLGAPFNGIVYGTILGARGSDHALGHGLATQTTSGPSAAPLLAAHFRLLRGIVTPLTSLRGDCLWARLSAPCVVALAVDLQDLAGCRPDPTLTKESPLRIQGYHPS
jgi:hypothetical protein